MNVISALKKIAQNFTRTSKMIPKRIGLIGFDGAGTIDMAGAAAAFTCAQIQEGDRGPRRCYEVIIVGLSNEPFTVMSGLIFQPHKTFKNAPPLDTLIIPGGLALIKPQIGRPVAAFVKARAGCTRRIVSFCSGIYGLAMTGLLAGRRVATHWRYAQDVARRFPELQVDDNAIFLKDGPFYTSAGATAGIDLVLSLIEEDFGAQVALAVARELVVYLKRPGGQEQYSEPLQFQTQSISRLSELATWMLSHMHEDLSVETLAAKACLCPRHFTRRFKIEFGTTPADFVERLRLDEARRRLSNGDNRVESVGISVGFRSAGAFRRAFERRLGVNPSDYRRRFATSSSLSAIVDRSRRSIGFGKAA
jgi:transcriptional regulator GlxA family with amidase domain